MTRLEKKDVVTLPTADPAVLLKWYDRHARILPWRASRHEIAEPYHVWLSEIMLQQTTVKVVIPYFERFLGLWPNIAALAQSDDETVMAAWAGLGYYSRARKLIACARMIVKDHHGRFPHDEAILRTLPGIGPYTAAAIAAIAFQRRAVVIDGNVERVMTRLGRISTPLPQAKHEIRELAQALTPDMRPGDYAQAVMDLGATICTPRRPSCGLCPWAATCQAQRHGDAEDYPKRPAKSAKPERQGVAYVVRQNDQVLLMRRPPRGLLGGMAGFPCSEWDKKGTATRNALTTTGRPLAASAIWQTLPGRVTHVFTHFRLEIEVQQANVGAEFQPPDGHFWWAIQDMTAAGLPSLMHKIARHAGVV